MRKKATELLNDACGLLTELEHYSEDDYINYRLDELFREVVKLDDDRYINVDHIMTGLHDDEEENRNDRT